jgi:hypothetical protein
MDKRPSLLALGTALIFLGIAGVPPPALGDPCLMVYPDSPCAYHYDPAEHYTVGPGNPLYHPAYDRGGEVLIEVNTNDVAYEVYQAPSLVGFVMDAENQGYFTIGTDLDVIVDGFCNEPTTYANVLVVFDRIEPEWCEPSILVEGSEVFYDGGLGWYYPIGDLVVSAPTPWGNNYSDTVTLDVVWQNCYGVRIYAFSDENYNLVRDGAECFSAYSHDTTVPAGRSTWGAIKALYSE